MKILAFKKNFQVISDTFCVATVKEAKTLINSSAKIFLYSFDYLSKNTPWEPPTDYGMHYSLFGIDYSLFF